MTRVKKLRGTHIFEAWALDAPPDEIGRLLKEYIAEANHAGWEGFSPRDMTGIRKFVEDLKLYYLEIIKFDPDYFRIPSSVNPQ